MEERTMIKLNIEITSPLDPDDRDLLSGIAVMTLAIANHEMAKEHFPETFADDEGIEAAGEEPAPHGCGAVDPRDAARVCSRGVAHRGRHAYRRAPVPEAGAQRVH
jgi:hypothetical protein